MKRPRPAPITIRGRTLAVHRPGAFGRPVVVELIRGEVRQRWEVETYLEAAALQAKLAAIYQGRRG